MRKSSKKQKNAPREPNKNRTPMIYNNVEVEDFGGIHLIDCTMGLIINGQAKRVTKLMFIGR